MGSADDLVTAYWEYRRRFLSDDRDVRRSAGECWGATEAIETQMRDNPNDVVALLVELADAAPDEPALAYLGAGPVEDLLREHGGQIVFDRVEGWARRNERFRTAVRCAWFDGHVPPDVEQRLRALGGPL